MFTNIVEIERKKVVDRQIQIAIALGLSLSQVQYNVLTCLARYIIWISGARSGKSLTAGEICASELTLPGRHIWIVGPTYDLAKKEFEHCLTFLSKLKTVDNTSLLSTFKVDKPKEGRCVITTPYGSWLETRSIENPNSLLGEELNLLILSEAGCQPLDPYKRILIGRISSRKGRVIAPSTGAGDIGLFPYLINESQKEIAVGNKEWALFSSTTIEANPVFSKEEYELRKRTMDEAIFKEQFGGELVSKRGLVFNFDESEAQEIDVNGIKNYTIYFGIKYHYINGCAVSVISYDFKNKKYILINDKFILKTHLNEIIRDLISEYSGFRIGGIICDSWDSDTFNKLKMTGITVSINNEERQLGKIGSLVARVRKLQQILFEKKLIISKLAFNFLNEIKNCKWPDKKKEGSDLLEPETPLPKYYQVLDTVSMITSFFERL